MRKPLLASLLLSFAGTQAQWTTPDVNTILNAPSTTNAVVPMIAPGPDGSTYVCWFESTANYRLMMQRLGADGVAMWEQGGIIVSDEPQNTAVFRYDLKADHAGNAVVAFQDERSGTLDVVAYRIDPTGDMLWGEGVSLPTPDGTGLSPVIGVLSDDRVVIAWNTDRSPATIAYRILPATGIPTAGTPEEITGTGNCARPAIIPDNNGGFWLQYTEQEGFFLNPATPKATHFNASGTSTWNGVISTAMVPAFYFPTPISDGSNGFYISFNSGNASAPGLTDVYVQRVFADGTTWTDSGLSVETGSSTNRYQNNMAPALLEDGGVMVAYSRKNSGQSEGGVSVQRFSATGEAQLGNDGATVTAISAQLHEPFGIIPSAEGAVVAYSAGGFNAETISAVRLTLQGTIVTPPAIFPLATTGSNKDDGALRPFYNGTAVAVWADERAGGLVLAQPIQLADGTGIAEANNNNGVRLLNGAAPELLFERTFPADLNLTFFSSDGKLLGAQRPGAQRAGARIALQLPAHAAGAVLVVVRSGEERIVLRTTAQ